jgi:hypothetical protein
VASFFVEKIRCPRFLTDSLPSKLRLSLVLGESLSSRYLWHRILSRKYDVQDLSMTPLPSKLRPSLVLGESLSCRDLWHCHGKCDSEQASAWPPIFEVCSPTSSLCRNLSGRDLWHCHGKCDSEQASAWPSIFAEICGTVFCRKNTTSKIYR